MAYFEKRSAGWMAQIRRRGMSTLSRTFDRKSDAEAWAREIEREAQRGNSAVFDTSAQRTTMQEVIERFRAGLLEGYSKSHRAPVESRLNAIDRRLGALFLANIRPTDLARWRDEMLAQGAAGQSARHALNLVSRLFSFAEQEMGVSLPAGNPCKAVRKPPVAKGRTRRPSQEEFGYLLQAADRARAHGVRQILVLAVETSMRQSELLGLEWKHVVLNKRTAHLTDTKNGESRTVALSGAAVAALQSLPRRLDGRVFGWKPVHENGAFEKLWQRTLARARGQYEADCAAGRKKPDPAFLADLRFHDLRHEATSRLFEKGLGIMEVASMTGHKSLAMLKRYTHIEAEKLAKKLG